MRPVIRPAIPDDAPTLAPLLAEVNDLHAAALPNRFRRVPDGPELTAFLHAQLTEVGTQAFVAENGGVPSGYLVAKIRATPPLPIAVPSRYAEIDTLVVASAVRRHGVGRALVDRAHRWIADQGIDDVLLVVWEFNTTARGFYESLGYVTQRRTLRHSVANPSAAGPLVPANSNEAPIDPRRALQPGVTISRAGAADAESLLKLQYLGYQAEAARYDDWSIPPLTEPLANVLHAVETQRVLVARLGNEIVGSVRGRLVEGTCLVGRLVVHPRIQGLGLGSHLLREIEAIFPEATRFELFTGHRSEANLRLYQRLGYVEVRLEEISPELMLVYLEKRPTAPKLGTAYPKAESTDLNTDAQSSAPHEGERPRAGNRGGRCRTA